MELLTRITRVRQEADEINSYRLVSANGEPLPPFDAGSHVDVQVASGLVRQYSLCNDPAEQEAYEIAVKREPASRGGSVTIHQQFKVDDLVRISRPRNNFPIRADAANHVLLGAGIGITPLLSMASHLATTGARFHLHYFFRSIEHAAFYDVLSAHRFEGKVSLHCGLDQEATRVQLGNVLGERSDNAHAYLCGPQPFIVAALAEANRNWPIGAVHKEHFQAHVDQSSLRQSPFRIRLASTGEEYPVAIGQTILEALDECGIYAARSCEQGFCGTCEIGLLDGCADHRDDYLTEEEKRDGNRIMPCVSRAKGPLLVLDI